MANCSSLYWRLVIHEVILVKVIALMEIGEEGAKKGSWIIRFETCCQALLLFQSLASWTEDRRGWFSQNGERLPGGIPGGFVAIVLDSGTNLAVYRRTRGSCDLLIFPWGEMHLEDNVSTQLE